MSGAHRLGGLALATWIAAGSAAAEGPAAGPDGRPRRVLSIHAFEPGVPVDAIFTAGLRAGLPLGTDLALYSEHLDRLRFPEPAYEVGFGAWLRTKYAAEPPDAIVAVGADALDFLADPRTAPFPGVPVVFGMVPEDAARARPLPPTFTGVPEHFAIRETLALARALFPDTRRVALVGGASAQDRTLNELLRREVSGAAPALEVVELFGLPMETLQERLRALPGGTVVVVAAFFRDGAGRPWTGPQSIPAIASASPAPLFTFYAHLLGLGTTGGVQTDFGESGRAVARSLLRVLAGEPPGAIPVRPSGPGAAVLDGRVLDRFGVPDARLPAGVEIRFREPPPWVRYLWAIGLAGGALLVQSALIALLLLERRRRWWAEAMARENLAVVARMSRVSALGELVGSLAHEINSPLGAVLNNAEAAQRYLAAGTGELGEVRSCLDDIVRDVERASEVLRRIRGALRHESWTPVALDAGALIRDALRLVQAELRDRGATVDVRVAPGLPAVTGDAVQLVQVLLNLVLNALDAVAPLPEGQRRVRISAEARGDGLAVRVEDSGPGVPPAVAPRVFDPFFTTKATGLGMGLAVARSIVEAHGGAIALAAAPGGGAAFEVTLPAAEGDAAAGAAAGA